MDDGAVDLREDPVGGHEEVAAREGGGAAAGRAYLRRGALEGGARRRRELVADEVDRQQESVGLEGGEAGGPRQRRPRQLARHAEPAASDELGAEHEAVAAEVDQGEELDVGAQLGGRDPEVGAHLGHLEHGLVVAALHDVTGQRREPREAVDLDAQVAGTAAATARPGGPRRTWRRTTDGWGRRVEERLERVELREQTRTQVGGLQELGLVGEAEDPAEQGPRVGVRRRVDDRAVRLGLHRAAMRPVRLDPPRHGG